MDRPTDIGSSEETRATVPATRNGTARRALGALGWFVLGFAWLATASALIDLLLATLATVAATQRGSIWATPPAVSLGALLAGTCAVGIARRHARLGYETLRATWAVAIIDLGMAMVATLRDGALNETALYEGVGFLAAAVIMTPWSRRRAIEAVESDGDL